MDAEKIFLEYAGQYDRSNGRIDLKITHTLEVVKVMRYLTDALHLSAHQAYLAHLCAMFHDIGRFEQLRIYNTFLDFKSIDHAAFGCRVLEENGMLEELCEKDRQMVLAAIRNHNRLAIEPGLDEETLLYCRLIRDADKCDIFRVFACEDMVDTMGETESMVAAETISDLLLEKTMQHCCVKKEDRKTGLDIWVSFLAFFFDMNYKESIALQLEKGYYRQPFDRVVFQSPETQRRVKLILDEVERFMRGRISGKIPGPENGR